MSVLGLTWLLLCEIHSNRWLWEGWKRSSVLPPSVMSALFLVCHLFRLPSFPSCPTWSGISFPSSLYQSPEAGGSLRREHGKCSARLPSSGGPGVKILVESYRSVNQWLNECRLLHMTQATFSKPLIINDISTTVYIGYTKQCDWHCQRTFSFRNHIVAEEKPDSSATISKIRVNVLILVILADKMAFSLTTMNLDYKVLGWQCTWMTIYLVRHCN